MCKLGVADDLLGSGKEFLGWWFKYVPSQLFGDGKKWTCAQVGHVFTNKQIKVHSGYKASSQRQVQHICDCYIAQLRCANQQQRTRCRRKIRTGELQELQCECVTRNIHQCNVCVSVSVCVCVSSLDKNERG